MRALDPHLDETFVEIGPGRGALTTPLAALADRVIAFEIDRDLVAALRGERLRNVIVVEGDFLDVAAGALMEKIRGTQGPAGATRLRVAGNLPYNVGSAILFKLGELYNAGIPFVDATVMLQREVAERLVAPVGTREYGVLSVLVRHWADVDRLLLLPPGAFRPAPKVHSAVVRLRFHPPAPQPRDGSVFRALTAAIFTRRRKTLVNALQAYRDGQVEPRVALDRAGIDGRRRPETLDIAELVRLSDTMATTRPNPGASGAPGAVL
jgi:16S rRNA (adenine1518-N6/adenine1519-N6)-dimethyltransferase